MPESTLWVIFCVVAAATVAIDLGVLHRKAHTVRPREAAAWSGVWVAIALGLNLLVLLTQGQRRGLEFFTGYLIELSLSVDNIFVFVLIFTYFRVPPAFQHRVLFWGIVGAVVMRGLFIGGGIFLLRHFEWLTYILGALLVVGAIQLLKQDKIGVDPSRNRLLRVFRRWVPMAPDYDGQRFFTRRDGRLLATPLMAVLIVVETTDVVFAMDSIPAILAITRDPFIVFASNICAILGLRSFYFLFAALVEKLRFLRYGLAVVLGFVGLKMVLSHVYEISILFSLSFVAAVLGASVVLSLLIPPTPSIPTTPDPRDGP